jgi:hypothetical protein
MLHADPEALDRRHAEAEALRERLKIGVLVAVDLDQGDANSLTLQPLGVELLEPVGVQVLVGGEPGGRRIPALLAGGDAGRAPRGRSGPRERRRRL